VTLKPFFPLWSLSGDTFHYLFLFVDQVVIPTAFTTIIPILSLLFDCLRADDMALPRHDQTRK
jgi:hypothetical protein